jgi:hemolysin activation/secretion protein
MRFYRSARRACEQPRDLHSRLFRKIRVLVITCAAFCPTIDVAAATPLLGSVVIRGSSVYDAPTLFTLYSAALGKPIDREHARAIVEALATRYAQDGYSRPQIRVDDGLIAAGLLRIDVLEARISDVKITGNPGPHLARLERMGSTLAAGQPLRQQDMQTALRRMRALPGLSLAASTERDGADANAYRLDLDADFEPLSGVVRFTNRGTDQAGPSFVLGQIVANGLLGGETSLGTTFSTATDTEEFHGLGLLARVGIGDDGARTSYLAFRSRSNPHEPGADLDDLYLRDRISLDYQRPLGRSAHTLSVSFDLDDLAIERAGTPLRDERLRLLALGWAATWAGGRATQSAISVELVKGLSGLGAGLQAVDLASDPRRADFLAARATLARLTRFGPRWSVRLDAFAQQSAHVLPYGERFKIGGDRLGRGFEVAEIAGDEGLGAKVEVRRHLPVAATGWLYTFYDIGAAWKNDAPGRESATTVGFGYHTRSRAGLEGTFEAAQPLTHPDVEGNKDFKLFVELGAAF